MITEINDKEQHLLTFWHPQDRLTGSDLISKLILKESKVVDLITQAMLDVSSGTYIAVGPTKWSDGTRSDVDIVYDSNEEEEEVKFHHNWRDVFDMRSTMSMHVPMRIIRNGIRRCKDDILKEQQTRARRRNLRSLQQLLNLLEEIKMTKRMWVPRDLVLEVVTNSDVLSCYKHTPLHAFNYIAMKESETVSDTDSIGRALYDSQVTFIRRPGVYGTIHDNSLIDVRPYEEEDESGSFSTELRISKDDIRK
ncbi:hypothetical protein G6F46_011850 [Rhizopus delemar]|uniref:Uncharacterized protein n=2 Tax=Rhizopus TaxID=4842 RepID=A0A9P6YT71_9FUNG|nr:hypothetical protein G6F36_012951 [Rhizopus arrhizus]KAG1446747.1 hypothetical protein G6F55_011410 [Rhizopus delemar]KAG1489227.1 hypothetical protein G6F54_011588 [Rhizopus delemar]KAG1498687.1 hypothetical protein G6F53_011688 [Rhizopus delemar]KAG1520114.1 hypothetical protein G6F52_007971 [Rhizopus delemar]